MEPVQQGHRPHPRLNARLHVHHGGGFNDALMQLANNNVIHALGGQFLIRNSKLLDIALRLPPLFLMDQILLYDMGLNYFSTSSGVKTSPIEPKVHFTYGNMSGSASGTLANESMWETYGDIISSIAFNHFVSFCLCFNLFWFSILWVSLTTRQLVSFYYYLMVAAILPTSYLLNSHIVNLICNKEPQLINPITLLLCKFVSQNSQFLRKNQFENEIALSKNDFISEVFWNFQSSKFFALKTVA